VTTGYVPVVILGVLAAAFAILSMAASALLRPKRAVTAKYTPYESGITPFRLPKASRFPVKFYLVAMLFIVFDIETIFLFPWAITFRQLGLFGLFEMAVFIGLLFVAYLYVWQKGGLEWEGPGRERATGPRHAPLPTSAERGPGEQQVEALPVGTSGEQR
jgi:NADH-quinone oxidoreductase subunit A